MSVVHVPLDHSQNFEPYSTPPPISPPLSNILPIAIANEIIHSPVQGATSMNNVDPQASPSSLPLNERVETITAPQEASSKAQALLYALHQFPRNLDKIREQERAKLEHTHPQCGCIESAIRALIKFLKNAIDWICLQFISSNKRRAVNSFYDYQGHFAPYLYPASPTRQIEFAHEFGQLNPFIQYGLFRRRLVRFCNDLPTQFKEVEQRMEKITSDFNKIELPGKIRLPVTTERIPEEFIRFLSSLKNRFVQIEEHLYTHESAYCYLSLIGQKNPIKLYWPDAEAREFVFNRLKNEEQEFLESEFKKHCSELDVEGKGLKHFLNNASQALITHAVDAMISGALEPMLA